MSKLNQQAFVYIHFHEVGFDARKARRVARRRLKTCTPLQRVMYKDVARNCKRQEFRAVIYFLAKEKPVPHTVPFTDVAKRDTFARREPPVSNYDLHLNF